MRKNPFQVGGQGVGEGYIGRKELIQEISSSILADNERHSSIMISGLTRMGKTSLIRNCIQDEEKLAEKRIITVFLSVGTCYRFSQFLRKMIRGIKKACKNNGFYDKELKKLCKKAGKDDESRLSAEELNDILDDVFFYLNSIRVRSVIILDEFDGAVEAFEGKSTYFQLFREFVTSADYNITFILTCRRNLKMIETSLPTGSNLRGAFSERVVSGFTDEELEMYFDKIKECGVDLPDNKRQEIFYYAGRSPLLLSALAQGILRADESIAPEDIEISEIYKKYENDFTAYFDTTIDYMKAENQFETMIQLFVGPNAGVTKNDIDRLRSNGYIFFNEGEYPFIDSLTGSPFTYQTLSPHFVEYIRAGMNRDDSLKIWSELLKTECDLREIIRTELKMVLGEKSWEETLRRQSRQKNLYNVSLADRFTRQSRKNFGKMAAGSDVLDVISIAALKNIIECYWEDCFEEVFDPPYQMEELGREMNVLYRARNPLAHGTSRYLTEEDRGEVNRYCSRITEVIHRNRDRSR